MPGRTPAAVPDRAATPPAPPSRWPAWWPAGGIAAGALVVAVAALVLVRRRRPAPAAEDDPVEAEPPTAAPARAAPPPPAAPRPPAPTPAAPTTPTTLEIGFDALRMSLSLINATLHYRLTLTNAGSATAVDVTAQLDMIAAHVGQGDREQLDAGPGARALHHAVARLAPGETASWTGDLRLRLVDIATMRQGSALLFVPLVRIAARAGPGAGPDADPGTATTRAAAFVVGDPVAASGGRVAPFRLELGPRIVTEVSARRLDHAA